ncbi:MAG: hypothetical protein HY290_07725, partial [Planctomycetia bacterium]|nr:hypothetical protein [Planctomycetia bacterium]
GQAIYHGDTLMKKLLAHREQPIPSLRSQRSEVSDQVEAIFFKMVAKNVEDRYQTTADVIADLEACGGRHQASAGTQPSAAMMADPGVTSFLQEIGAASPKTALPGQPSSRFGKRPNSLWIGGGVVAALAVLAVLFTVFGNGNKDGKLAKSADKKSTPTKPAEDSTAARPPNNAVESWQTPAFERWMKQVADQPAPEEQVKAVVGKLRDLNPGFDGKVTPRIEFLDVTELQVVTDSVTDISPVRALKKLKSLTCSGSGMGRGKLADLSPLDGMSLTSLRCTHTRVSDLSPLRMMPLARLWCEGTQVSDLLPLSGMPLDYLNLQGTRVSDLSPLKGIPLTELYCHSTPVSDLSPLKDMKLTVLYCYGTPVFDLLPLKGMPLKHLNCDFERERDTDVLRSIKTLETINNKPVAEFWKNVDIGEP